MNSSQRCAKQIYNLANNLISSISKEEKLKSAFYQIEMTGTDKNPKSEKKPSFLFFDDEKLEKDFILQKTKEIINNDPKASILLLMLWDHCL